MSNKKPQWALYVIFNSGLEKEISLTSEEGEAFRRLDKDGVTKLSHLIYEKKYAQIRTTTAEFSSVYDDGYNKKLGPYRQAYIRWEDVSFAELRLKMVQDPPSKDTVVDAYVPSTRDPNNPFNKEEIYGED